MERIDFKKLSTRTIACLVKNNIFYYQDIENKRQSELLKIENLGRKSINELKLLLETTNHKPIIVDDGCFCKSKGGYFKDTTAVKRNVAYNLYKNGMKKCDVARALGISHSYASVLIHQAEWHERHGRK